MFKPAVLPRVLLVGMLLASLLTFSDDLAQAQDGDGDGSIWLTATSRAEVGWVIVDGTSQWLSPRCRQSIEGRGGSFEIVDWEVIDANPRATDTLTCGEVTAGYFGYPPDNSAPVVQALTSPVSYDVVPRLEVQGTATDNNGVTRVTVQIVDEDGQRSYPVATLADWGARSTAFSYSADLDPGRYHVFARAVDTAGNRSDWSRAWGVVISDGPIDNEAPSATMTSPRRGETVDEIVVDGTALDNVGVTRVQVRVSDANETFVRSGDAELSNQGGSSTSFRFDASGLADGQYQVSARGWDAAGNYGRWVWARVTVDGGDDVLSPLENLALIESNPTRNTTFDNLDYADTPMAQIPLSALTLDYDPYTDAHLDTSVSGYFRVKCDISHFAYDDPIVFPDQPGRAHLHMFFGNTEANAYSDFDSLLDTGSGSCNGENLNRTAYWVPALLDPQGNALIPFEVMVYYKNDNFLAGGGNELVEPFPDNLQMVVGNAMASSPQTAGSAPGALPVVSFNCGRPYADNQLSPVIPDGCQSDGGDRWDRALEMKIAFPQCFNPDAGTYVPGGAHVSYSEGGYYGTFCPDSHPVDLSSIMYRIFFSPNDYPDVNFNDIVLSSDVRGNTVLEGGTTAHADWFGAWHPSAMRQWVNNCNNVQADCEIGLLNTSPPIALRPRQQGFYRPGYLAPARDLMQLCPHKTYDPNAALQSVANCRHG